MKRATYISHCRTLAFLVSILLLTSHALTASSNEHVIYSFQPGNQFPSTGLISDRAGNLYGATYGSNAGNVYKVSPPRTAGGHWSETTIFTFSGVDGALPQASLVLDGRGNLYGTTFDGGTGSCNFTTSGCGVVFELSPQNGGGWIQTVLYNFQGGRDGAHPQSPLVFDALGNLYGSTEFGGDIGCPTANGLGCGVVFKLSPPADPGASWTESVIYAFHGGNDGANAQGALLLRAGVVYGTTYQGGGSSNCQGGCGLVYELNESGREKVIHRFTGSDGAGPAGLIGDNAGNLFGATFLGGESNWGTAYKLALSSNGNWTQKVLYNFSGGEDGGNPTALTAGQAGSLYGTTTAGGNPADCGWEPPFTGCGVVFRLTSTDGVWTEKVLHTFTGGTVTQDADGGVPQPSLVFGKTGFIYGATLVGGTGLCYTAKGNDSGCGTVYELAP
jgi:hypothetical protein